MKITVKINLAKIIENLKKYDGKKVILMVKADAYGHGLKEVAKATESLVEGFGVATVDEGVTLRQAGIKSKILVAQWLQDEIEVATEYDLTLSVGDFVQLDLVKSVGRKAEIKVNTGMNRFGFDFGDTTELSRKLEGFSPSGIYSHIFSLEAVKGQKERFERVVSDLNLKGVGAHLFSSSYAHLGDTVRLGIGVYQGAMTVTSTVVAVRGLHGGDNVGYGNKMPKSGGVAWVFGGYADGISREDPAPVLIGGKLREVVAVCMDTFAVYVGEDAVKVGDVVTLLGEDLDQNKLAKLTGTIPYVILTKWRGRTERIYQC